MVDASCKGKIRMIRADFFDFFDLGGYKFYELYDSRVWFEKPDLGIMAVCPPPGWKYGEYTDGCRPLVLAVEDKEGEDG